MKLKIIPPIKAVMLHGSRTNPNVTKDRLQDFDIVYVVDQMEYFLNNDYVKRFGEVAIMQPPNKMTLFESENSETFAYLMQFKDGNRIDLTLMSEELVEKYCYQDQLAKVLYDPVVIFKPIPVANDSSYYIKKLTQQQFYDCCN